MAGAEQYYRVIYYGDAASWNWRDQHMFDTLERLLAHRGPDAKAVVWAHNSHIGNAAFTEMGQVRGEHNIGQLARQRFGDDAALIGFGTDRGTVAAASDWDGLMEIKRVRPARDNSYEGRSRDTGIAAFLLETGSGQRASVRSQLAEPLLERAIGVIYRPETEFLSHYFQAELSRQFDAWIWSRKRGSGGTASPCSRPRRDLPLRALGGFRRTEPMTSEHETATKLGSWLPLHGERAFRLLPTIRKGIFGLMHLPSAISLSSLSGQATKNIAARQQP